MGQKRRFRLLLTLSALPPKADIKADMDDVCKVPILLQKPVDGCWEQ